MGRGWYNCSKAGSLRVCTCWHITVSVRGWPKVFAMDVENTHLVFIYAEELLHWSVGTEREREREREREKNWLNTFNRHFNWLLQLWILDDWQLTDCSSPATLWLLTTLLCACVHTCVCVYVCVCVCKIKCNYTPNCTYVCLCALKSDGGCQHFSVPTLCALYVRN